jgi:lantibiotic biosynthesis protein
MPAPPAFAPEGFFVFRTPLLPFSAASAAVPLRAPLALAEGADLGAALADDRRELVAALRDRVADPVVREALFIASPTLHEAMDAWLADPADARAHGVVDILVRYLARMAARPTPFGLFSACSLGSVGHDTRLTVAPRASYVRHTRLDTHYLAALCAELGRDDGLRETLTFRPNSGLYEVAGQVRYAESRADPKTRTLTHDLVSIERSPYLDATLARAASGARPADLAAALAAARPEVSPEKARAYVELLIENQVLVSDLAPYVTGPEPVHGLLDALAATANPAPTAGPLEAVDAALRALDAGGLGAPPARYPQIASALAALPAEPDPARLFQVDLYKPAPEARLGGAVLRELEGAVGLLTRIGPPDRDRPLDSFRAAFEERFGERLHGPLSPESTVPLVEVLDAETGIGFQDQGVLADPAPLLEGLDLPSAPAPERVEFGAREQHLLRRLLETTAARSPNWELSDDDLEALSNPHPAPLPDAFSVLAKLTATSREGLARGEFRLVVAHVSGPSGATYFGRFCHGSPELQRAVAAHLATEESMRPEAIYAEIVHLPEGRHGNILCRPSLRRYDIAYLGRSAAPAPFVLPVTDLRVGLSGGRIVLYSARHDREVVPRLTSAHNYAVAQLGVYRFLGALQHEQQTHDLVWSWGPLRDTSFLPRVSRGRVVLAAARWNMSKRDLAALDLASATERYRAAQAWRERFRLPRWVGLADGDNVLAVDLDNVLHVESFARLVKGRQSAALTELFVDEVSAVDAPEGSFVNEIVVPFVRRPAAPPAAKIAPARTQPGRVERVERSFPPGSEWLYAKLYTGTASADALLGKLVAPLIARTRAAGTARGWFFLRYAVPHWHLRLRVRGNGPGASAGLLRELHEAAAPFLRDGRLWKVQLDTYEREVGRYGGPAGVELCEALFEADSDAVLAALASLPRGAAADARWRLTLRGMHLLLLDFGLDLPRRLELVRQMRATFGAEQNLDATYERQLGAKFREERPSLATLVSGACKPGHPLEAGFHVLARRSEAMGAPISGLLAAARDERLDASITELAGSLLHMHACRLLRSMQREQELVLYDFLARLYESEGARARRGV